MTDLPWLRLYTDTVDNEKIRLLAFEDRWHYIAILCIKQQGILDHQNELLERKIAVKLGLQLRELDEVKRRLIDVELIDEDWNPNGWEKHQFKSDHSTDRVRKYRENNKKKDRNADETLLKRIETAIDTDTDTDTDTDKPKDISRAAKKNKRFKKPSIQEVGQYCRERNNNINPQRFVDHYESNGWKVGKNSMKDWKACVRTWEANEKNTANNQHRKETGAELIARTCASAFEPD